jgi:hypothetical protein
MSITKQYSVIDNISITSSSLTFEVTANDTFDVVGIWYQTEDMFCQGIAPIDIFAEFTAGGGGPNSGTVTICLPGSEGCDETTDFNTKDFTQVLNIITVETTEATPDCDGCDRDEFGLFDAVGEIRSLGDLFLTKSSCDNCYKPSDCVMEKGLLLYLLDERNDSENTITEVVELYKRYKQLCCE